MKALMDDYKQQVKFKRWNLKYKEYLAQLTKKNEPARESRNRYMIERRKSFIDLTPVLKVDVLTDLEIESQALHMVSLDMEADYDEFVIR